MSDHSELKRLAEGMEGWDNLTKCWPCDENGPDWQVGQVDEDGYRYPVLTIDTEQYDAESHASTLAQYYAAANPVAVLSLIAENKRLAELLECAQGDCRQAMQIIERLTPDAERYRWLRDDAVDPGTVIDKKVGVFNSEDGGYPIWEYRSGADLDSAIDAAMSKGATQP